MAVRILISGGGTGGHIFPALAIADTLKRRVNDAEIRFVGAKGRMEMDLVPKHGYPIEGLWITGIDRKLTLRNLVFPLKLISSLIRSRTILNQFKPHVVIGFGGFASGPVMEMALRKKIPCVIQEQNSFPGITNRLLGKRVQAICGAYESLHRFFPDTPVYITGNPLRRGLTDQTVTREEAVARFSLQGKKQVVLVMGGSLGARSLNEGMANAMEAISASPDIGWIWQTGKGYWNTYSDHPVSKMLNVVSMPFIDNMPEAYAAADLIISRAGALSISELCLVGKPVMLIPSPNVAEDHQTKNAKELESIGAAVIVPDHKAAEDMVIKAIRLLNNPVLCGQMAAGIKSLAKPDAAEQIVDIILKTIPE